MKIQMIFALLLFVFAAGVTPNAWARDDIRRCPENQSWDSVRAECIEEEKPATRPSSGGRGPTAASATHSPNMMGY